MTGFKQDPRVRVWNRLFTSTSSLIVERLDICESDAFADQTVLLDRATVLAGSHGGGKSLLISLLEAVFGNSTRIPPFVGNETYGDPGVKWASGKVGVTIRQGEERLTRLVDLSNCTEEREETWRETIASNRWTERVCAAELASDFNWYFQQLDPDNIENKRSYSPKELSAIRNILGRSYSTATVRTVILDDYISEDGDRSASFAPYIVADENGRSVTSTSMSLGETWIHQALWEISGLKPGCLLAVDEPESFLAMKGHRPFIDEIARKSLELDLQLVVATHSPEILGRFPIANTRMCIRGVGDGRIRIIQPESWAQVRSAVGIQSALQRLILVEDDFAAMVLQTILSWAHADPSEIEIVPAGGKSKALAAVDALSHTARIKCYAVLDADQREACDGKRIFALPGNHDPEKELLAFALADPVAVASQIGRSVDAVRSALEACEFLDHQYQITNFAGHLGVESIYATNLLVRGWLSQTHIAAQAMALCEAIAADDSVI